MLSLFNVSYQYSGGYGVSRITFSVENGEFAFLVGASGAGKTTIFKLINLELLPQQGHIILDSFNSIYLKKRDIPLVRRKIGIIFQDFKLLRDRTVFDNVAFALEVVGTPSRKIKRQVLETLKEVGLTHKRLKYPQELSGGEQQRVAIARALVNEPYILLADEPTGNLDKETAAEILDLLGRINSQGTTILMATHQQEMVLFRHKKVFYLKDGKVVP